MKNINYDSLYASISYARYLSYPYIYAFTHIHAINIKTRIKLNHKFMYLHISMTTVHLYAWHEYKLSTCIHVFHNLVA